MSTFTRFLKSIFSEDRQMSELRDTAAILRAQLANECESSAEYKSKLSLANSTISNNLEFVRILQAEMKGRSDGYDREISALKQQIDHYALRTSGIQVYGTAPAIPVDDTPQQEPSGPMRISQATRILDDEFAELLRQKISQAADGEKIEAFAPETYHS